MKLSPEGQRASVLIVTSGGKMSSKPIAGASYWFHGVMVSTLDFESSDPSSSLGGTWSADTMLFNVYTGCGGFVLVRRLY